MCMSAGGQVALPDWGWPYPDALYSEPSTAEVNQAITTDAAPQQSPSIAVDPQDPAHLVLAYMDYSLRDTGYAGIGVRVSRDGGSTWQPGSLTLPVGFDQGASDPITKFDAHGHVFVSFMAAAFRGTGAPPILNPGAGSLRSDRF